MQEKNVKVDQLWFDFLLFRIETLELSKTRGSFVTVARVCASGISTKSVKKVYFTVVAIAILIAVCFIKAISCSLSLGSVAVLSFVQFPHILIGLFLSFSSVMKTFSHCLLNMHDGL